MSDQNTDELMTVLRELLDEVRALRLEAARTARLLDSPGEPIKVLAQEDPKW